MKEKDESSWSGTVEDAFYNGEQFDRCRKLLQPEYSHSGRSKSDAFYIVACDIGRRGDDSVACVIKVTPQGIQPATKSLVNICVIPADTHFEDQAIFFKKLYYKYRARRLVVDGNGLGIGFMDYMVKSQIDPDTGDVLPDFGVYGGTQDNAQQEYKKFRTADTEEDAVYILKANAPVNTECYTALQVALSTGKLRLLIDETVAREKLLGTQRGQKMTPEERDDYLRPFKLTSILKEEVLNMREENEGINIILKRANRGIRKDKFSALIYGLYYIKIEEESKKRKKRFKASDWMFKN